MMEVNMNLTFPIADWLFGTSDLDRGLIGTILNGYDTRFLKKALRSKPLRPDEGRRDTGGDHGLHHLDGAAICARLRRTRHGHRSRTAPLYLLLRHFHQLLRGSRQIPRRPPYLGAADARAAG